MPDTASTHFNSLLSRGDDAPPMSPAMKANTPSTGHKIAARKRGSVAESIERARRQSEIESRERLKQELRLQFGLESAKVPYNHESPPGLRGAVHRVILSSRFDVLIGLVIVVNSITIGFEVTFELQQWDTTIFHRIEHIFLFIYTAELAVRFYAYGLACMRSGWVVFDFFLVTTGLFTTYLLEPLLRLSFLDLSDNGGDAVGMLLILRTFRLVRLARTVRLLVQFKVLWMLVRGLLSSAGTMIYIFILFFLVLYVFACMGVDLIAKPHFALTDLERAENPEYDALVMNHFSSIHQAMLTLIMFSTFDSVGNIYIPMCNHNPALVLYFITFMLPVSICLMNLVTAVIVESSFEQANQDKEVAKAHKAQVVKKIMPKLRGMFATMDSDGNGDITLQEFGSCDQDIRENLCEVFHTDDLVELFEVLDVDGGGSVSITEFCDEMTKLATTDFPIEQVRMLKQMSIVRTNVFNLEGRVGEMDKGICEMAANQEINQGKLDMRISAVERKLGTIDTSLADINKSLQMILAR
jgi:voltage-gated sodium channel